MERALLKKLTKLTTFLLLTTLFLFQLTALADTAPANKTLNISLTIGKKDIMINDTKLTGEAPFITKDGSTLVPLRVITTAFGAVLAYDAPTKTIGLKYNGHDLSLTIDNKMATVDGKAIEMKTAPQLLNGTTMVPVRFIIENFGATILFDKVTKQITITGDAPVVDTTGDLNSDAGKTKIGDSYNNWSMKYPTGLVKSYQSYKGDYLTFEDANGEYDLNLYIDPSDVQNMSADGLLNKLSDNVSGTVLSSSTLTVNGLTFARILSKSDATYTESRAYFGNGNIYMLIMDILDEKNYKNPLKSSGYKEFMDSFKLTFDVKDMSAKDLSAVKDGYRVYQNDDYGFSLNIPADWDKGYGESSKFSFKSSGSDKKNVYISIHSLAEGETLDSWAAKDSQLYTDLFVPAFGYITSTESTTIGGEPAKQIVSSNNPDGTWVSDTEYYIIKGKLKYSIDFEYPKDTPADSIKSTQEALTNSFKFTNKLNPELETIKDDIIFTTNKSKIVSKNLGVSFEIPENWKDTTSSSEKATNLSYDFIGGSIDIVTDVKSKEDAAKIMEGIVRESVTTEIVAITDTTIAGLSAKIITFKGTDKGEPKQGAFYVFSNSTKDFLIVSQIGNAFATAAAQQRIDAVIASFQITP
jgi:hypothetical protein